VRRHAGEAGRDPGSIDFGYSAGWYDDRQEKPGRDGGRMVFTGTPDQVVSDIREFEALGVRHLILGLTGSTPEETLDRMERFATEVKPFTN
jgi:alkanesulfonate monooxygenase SsuD/methylene tetrahydromethanopterin reductase-like flavin-dependent oxidoreductase (luciferase family)